MSEKDAIYEVISHAAKEQGMEPLELLNTLIRVQRETVRPCIGIVLWLPLGLITERLQVVAWGISKGTPQMPRQNFDMAKLYKRAMEIGLTAIDQDRSLLK